MIKYTLIILLFIFIGCGPTETFVSQPISILPGQVITFTNSLNQISTISFSSTGTSFTITSTGTNCIITGQYIDEDLGRTSGLVELTYTLYGCSNTSLNGTSELVGYYFNGLKLSLLTVPKVAFLN